MSFTQHANNPIQPEQNPHKRETLFTSAVRYQRSGINNATKDVIRAAQRMDPDAVWRADMELKNPAEVATNPYAATAAAAVQFAVETQKPEPAVEQATFPELQPVNDTPEPHDREAAIAKAEELVKLSGAGNIDTFVPDHGRVDNIDRQLQNMNYRRFTQEEASNVPA